MSTLWASLHWLPLCKAFSGDGIHRRFDKAGADSISLAKALAIVGDESLIVGKATRSVADGRASARISQTEALIDGFLAGFALADKGYDSDAFVEIIKGRGATPVMPPRSNRKTPRDYDKDVYKERNLVERLFQKLNGYRRVATRYERLALNYMTMLSLSRILIWLK